MELKDISVFGRQSFGGFDHYLLPQDRAVCGQAIPRDARRWICAQNPCETCLWEVGRWFAAEGAEINRAIHGLPAENLACFRGRALNGEIDFSDGISLVGLFVAPQGNFRASTHEQLEAICEEVKAFEWLRFFGDREQPYVDRRYTRAMLATLAEAISETGEWLGEIAP